MNKYRILILLILISNVSISQSAGETIDWLKYNLKKYYADDYSCRLSQLQNSYYKDENTFYWKSYEYDFKDKLFNIIIHSYKKNIKTSEQQTIENKKISINLSYVSKIENESKIDTSRFFKTFVDNSYFCLRFNFKSDVSENFSPGKKTVREFNLDKNEEITHPNTNFQSYFIRIDTGYDNFQNDIPNRIIKALEHLVKLYGGTLIKDVF